MVDEEAGEPDAEDQAFGVEMGAPVPVRGQGEGVAQEFRDEGEQGQEPEQAAAGLWAAGGEAEREEAEQGKGEVEMLFDAERPGGAEAGHAEVILEEKQVVRVDGIVVEEGLGEGEKAERGEVGGKGAEPARGPEAAKGEGAGGLVCVGLGAQVDAADEKAGEDEEEVDADSEGIERGDAMREEDHGDGDGTCEIEAEVALGVHGWV